MRIRKLIPLALLAIPAVLSAHDLFLKPEHFVVPANRPVRLAVLNGTFTTSENAIVRSRLADLSIAGPGGRVRLDSTALVVAGTRSRVTAPVAGPGTYVAGLSTHPNEIDLTGAEFRSYLEEEGLDDVVEARRREGSLERPVRERYAKHVKAVFRAGAPGGEAWAAPLGYPVEILPLADPYSLGRGDTLRVRLLVGGRPAPEGTVVLAGGRSPSGARHAVQKVRSAADGSAGVVLTAAGAWYVKFISIVPVALPGVNYVSEWATMTFAVGARPSP